MEKLYRDVKGEALDKTLDELRQLIAQQAETERSCRRAKMAAKRLVVTQEKLSTELDKARGQLEQMRSNIGRVAYRVVGFGPLGTPEA